MKLLSSLMMLLLISCASVPQLSNQADKEAKKFDTSPNKAGLYLYRNQSYRMDTLIDVYLNGELLVKTMYKSYIYVELPAGKYTLKDKSGSTMSFLDLELKAGENTFVWQQVSTSILSYQSKLILVHNEEGKQGVMESRRIDTALKK